MVSGLGKVSSRSNPLSTPPWSSRDYIKVLEKIHKLRFLCLNSRDALNNPLIKEEGENWLPEWGSRMWSNVPHLRTSADITMHLHTRFYFFCFFQTKPGWERINLKGLLLQPFHTWLMIPVWVEPQNKHWKALGPEPVLVCPNQHANPETRDLNLPCFLLHMFVRFQAQQHVSGSLVGGSIRHYFRVNSGSSRTIPQ